MDPQAHGQATKQGIERARAAGVKLGRPLNTKRDAEIAALVAQGWGILRIAGYLHCSQEVVRRVRDRANPSSSHLPPHPDDA